MLINQSFMENGFEVIDAGHYIKNSEHLNTLESLNHLFQSSLKADGPRNRAYLKLLWQRHNNSLSLAQNQNYFQTAASNADDGGKVREFKTMPSKVLNLSIVKSILKKNMAFVAGFEPLKHEKSLVVGLHFIQYLANKYEASYSSPVGLHIDDEPLVFVHLLNLSPNAIGGDNLIASLDDKVIKHVVRLENPMDTIVLNNNCYHAVTPLGSRDDKAMRNIILFTIEPNQTQLSVDNKGAILC